MASTLSQSTDMAQRLQSKVSSLSAQETDGYALGREETLKKVAQEFEGVLLSAWLEEIQKGTLDPAGAGDAGSETLRSLGTQAVAQALSQRGGLGIARMIVHHFTATVSPSSLSEKTP